MNETIPVSIIDYLNALPLNLAFKKGKLCKDLKLIYDFPSQCADNLASGHVEVGLISSVEYQRIPNLSVASGVCIASRKKVRSVVIVTNREFKDIRTLAVDRFSRSSTALARILFHARTGTSPRLLTMAPDLKEMLQYADAALVIGDAALRQESHGHHTLDLAQLWYEMTGLPFVFAFWALTRKAADLGLADRFRKAKVYGIKQIKTMWEPLGSQFNMPPDEIKYYLTHNIHYDLGEEEKASLDLFFTYCAQWKLIPQKRKLNFV